MAREAPAKSPMSVLLDGRLPERLLFFSIVAYYLYIVIKEGILFTSNYVNEDTLGFSPPGVKQGWMFGRNIDLSDFQWREFRNSLPLIFSFFAFFAVVHRLARALVPHFAQTVILLLSVTFVGVLHGTCSIYVLSLVQISFLVAQFLAGKKYGLPLIWAFHVAVLLFVRIYDGFPFSSISPSLAWLDDHRGLLRWQIHYNLLLLRMVSFSADLHASRLASGTDSSRKASSSYQSKELNPATGYSFQTYLLYCLFPPLFAAGPIITYSDFSIQYSQPPRVNARGIVLYAVRFAFNLLVLELVCHLLHFNTVATNRLWRVIEAAGVTVTPFHYAITSLWVLIFMWLKFVVIWRFFRLASLAAGIDPPENMTRCVCNNYTIQGFWRSWHVSYYRWLVRYVYVPLGGYKWRAINVWGVFGFVALWHDLEPRLAGWAVLMAGFMVPEMIVLSIARSPDIRRRKDTALIRHLGAVLAALNLLVLLTANMAGFVVGLDGVTMLWQKVLSDPWFLLALASALFCTSHLMFMVREVEEAKQALESRKD